MFPRQNAPSRLFPRVSQTVIGCGNARAFRASGVYGSDTYVLTRVS